MQAFTCAAAALSVWESRAELGPGATANMDPPPDPCRSTCVQVEDCRCTRSCRAKQPSIGAEFVYIAVRASPCRRVSYAFRRRAEWNEATQWRCVFGGAIRFSMARTLTTDDPEMERDQKLFDKPVSADNGSNTEGVCGIFAETPLGAEFSFFLCAALVLRPRLNSCRRSAARAAFGGWAAGAWMIDHCVIPSVPRFFRGCASGGSSGSGRGDVILRTN